MLPRGKIPNGRVTTVPFHLSSPIESSDATAGFTPNTENPSQKPSSGVKNRLFAA
jgi:hypothetical protein